MAWSACDLKGLVACGQTVGSDRCASSAEALARSYGGQLDPYASTNLMEFSIAMLTSRARLQSADPASARGRRSCPTV